MHPFNIRGYNSPGSIPKELTETSPSAIAVVIVMTSNLPPEIRVTDNKARLTLPRSFANSTLLLEVRGDNEIVIRRAKVVPLGDAQDEPERITLSARDWDAFVAAMDDPPEPNAALRELMSEFGPWRDAREQK